MKRKKWLRKISPKRRELKKEYLRKREIFLREHPYCQWFMAEYGIDEKVAIDNMGIVLIKGGFTPDGIIGFSYVTVPKSCEIHHKKGRGKYYLDESTWMAVQAGHDKFIHGNPKEAYAKGYMLPRI